MLKSLVCALFIAAASFASMGQAVKPTDEVPAGDSRAVRAVVSAQLKALADEQPVQAFSYAAPAIRSQFQDPAVFMDMVRRTYPMLIRPASVSFFRPEGSNAVITQGVQFRDRDGKLWIAVYELQRQPDKSWRISGCAVAPGNESSTT